MRIKAGDGDSGRNNAKAFTGSISQLNNFQDPVLFYPITGIAQ
jgi:hypothetical protein